MPPLLVWAVHLVAPHTHTVPYHAFDDANLVSPPRRPMRNLDQRIVCLLSVRLCYHALVVI